MKEWITIINNSLRGGEQEKKIKAQKEMTKEIKMI